MDKRRAISIMTKAAQLYKKNLEDQKILFLFGVPSEIKKELQSDKKVLSKMNTYEVVFHRYNFLHLTGVRIKNSQIASAIHFYEKCLGNRLTDFDFDFTSDGSSVQKLDVLEDIVNKNI